MLDIGSSDVLNGSPQRLRRRPGDQRWCSARVTSGSGTSSVGCYRLNPVLKAPGTWRLKLKYEICFQALLSNSTCDTTVRQPVAAGPRGPAGEGARHGLTLVRFSAQPEPFLTLKSTEPAQRVPRKVLTSSRKVDEWKSLLHGYRVELDEVQAALVSAPVEVGRCWLTQDYNV